MIRSKPRLDLEALDQARANYEATGRALSAARTAAQDAQAALTAVEGRVATVDGDVTVDEMLTAETAVRLTHLKLGAMEGAHAAALQCLNEAVADEAAESYHEWRSQATERILEKVAEARQAMVALADALNDGSAGYALHRTVLSDHGSHQANERIRNVGSESVFVDGQDVAPFTPREIIFRVAGEAMNAIAAREGAGAAESMLQYAASTVPPIGDGR